MKKDDSIEERETRCVMVDLTDLWALQKSIKYNTFMFDPRNGKTMFPSKLVEYPSGSVSMHTAWRLRDKVNSLILRFVMEEIDDTRLSMPLDYDEAWCIDAILSIDSYGNARVMLVQIMQVIWEYEFDVELKTGVMNKEMKGADGKFDPNDLIEYVSTKNGKEAEGFYTLPPTEGDPDP